MSELEKKIEEAAEEFSCNGNPFDQDIAVRSRAFIIGAKSPEAKEYWQKGMYTEEEVKELFINRSKKFSTSVEPFNAILLKQDLDWFEQNKKKEE
jgi:hypothetical protein